MTLFQAIISGAIQGITEFFPISSSGHLVILHSIFGLEHPQVSFDIFLHVGTLFSLLIYFRKDIFRLFTDEKKKGLFVILGTLPIAVAGLLFRDYIEQFFLIPRAVGAMLIFTGGWLFMVNLKLWQNQKKRFDVKPLNLLRTLAIGFAQGIGILPGISRSGATIGTAIISGMSKEAAFSFSFLLAIPAISGAAILKICEQGSLFFEEGAHYFFVGGLTAMLVGIIVLRILWSLIESGRLYIFGIYCIVVGISVVVLL